jgi:multidrug resistance efflux pump
MRKRWIKIIVLTILGTVGTAGLYAWLINWQAQRRYDRLTAIQKSAADLDRTYKVRRADLVIGLRMSGNISASQKHKLSLQANYKTRLLTVVDENTKVTAGDVLATFETDELVEKIDELKMQLSNSEKELAIAVENAKMQESSNEVEIKTAEDRLDQAIAAQRKYLRFERANTRNGLLLKISTAETAAIAAQEEYEEAESVISNSGVGDETTAQANEKKLRTLENKIESASNTLSSAQMEYKAFQRYDNPIKLLRLQNELDQATLNLEKVKISTASNLVQKNKQVDTLRQNIRRTASTLERYESYMPQMKLVAPTDGIVIYADPDQRWNKPDIKTGMDIWKGMIVLTIPEMSTLMVDFDLPEQFRSKTKVSDRVIITPDSLPTLKVYGQISQIATLPVNQNIWDSNSPKVYNSRISLDQQNPKLVNGMSVQVEVISKVVRDTLFVPVEAVFEDSGKFFVYVSQRGTPKEMPVTIGESNDSFVQITQGLAENDVVYLYRPYQKKQDSGS